MSSKSPKTRVGIVGCGNISGIYCKNIRRFAGLELAACADLDRERAQAKATEYEIPKACSVAELLSDPDIDLVLNLTIPKAHFEVARKALAAGKHVYNEKPLSLSVKDAQKLLALAKSKKLRVGCAPDTVLGGGIQTCRKLIEDGWIGQPVAACGFMMGRGPESWHPDPEFFYKPGAGPLFDMGPYYLSAFMNLLGPVASVSGSAKASFSQRMITSQPKFGQIVRVETPTHVIGILHFENGATGNLITSFDIPGHGLPNIEVYGSEGSLRVPDPNTFTGPVLFQRRGAREWKEVPLTHSYGDENYRGLGLADMAASIRNGGQHRANAEIALHVLETMHAILQSAKAGRNVKIKSTIKKPAPLAMNLVHGTVN